MAVYELNPLRDPHWADLVQRHARASVFHPPGWLAALQRCYGYEATAFTTTAPGAELQNGLVFCRVRSRLTGSRLVSLPFSDHCDPLVDDAQQLAEICRHLDGDRLKNGWRYIELRPRSGGDSTVGFGAFERFRFHALDLRPDLDALFRSFHKDSVQRKIRRAEREGVTYEEGRSETLLRKFYALLLHTRRRHQLPPPPFAWFCHLAAGLGHALKVRIASREEKPLAGIVTIRHRDTMVYKYGASDAALHKVGGMQCLFWNAIEDAREQGCVTLDFGRTELANESLSTFKDRWGATQSIGTYWRTPASQRKSGSLRTHLVSGARRALGHAPDAVLVLAGRMLYKHVG
jgi:CelD/BcsL family acetyltransferase involved in cellulose biosynthesis